MCFSSGELPEAEAPFWHRQHHRVALLLTPSIGDLPLCVSGFLQIRGTLGWGSQNDLTFLNWKLHKIYLTYYLNQDFTMYTLLETNISPFKRYFWVDDFPNFPRWDMFSSLEDACFFEQTWIIFQTAPQLWSDFCCRSDFLTPQAMLDVMVATMPSLNQKVFWKRDSSSFTLFCCQKKTIPKKL